MNFAGPLPWFPWIFPELDDISYNMFEEVCVLAWNKRRHAHREESPTPGDIAAEVYIAKSFAEERIDDASVPWNAWNTFVSVQPGCRTDGILGFRC